jgi:Flp pilus assembly protein TadB
MRWIFAYFVLGLGVLTAVVFLSRLIFWSAHRAVLKAFRESGRQYRGPYRITLRRCVAGLALLFGVSLGGAWLLKIRPHFGLLVFFLGPAALRWQWRTERSRRVRQLELSAVHFFEALLGLLRVGLSFPSALFHLVHHFPGPFAEALLPYLNRFEEGRSLNRCLERFQVQTGLGQVEVYLSLLGVAYREGLSMVPLLEQAVPVLASEQGYRERSRSLRRAAAVQAGVASLIPWILFGVLFLFQPEVAEETLAQPYWWIVAVGAVACEGLGTWWLWKLSSFY